VLRVLGVPFGHTFIALKSAQKGLSKLVLNDTKIQEDLENNWAVVAEAIQTVLRREGFSKPYEALKALTRTNEKITRSSVHEFILSLEIEDNLKDELLKITPNNYTGIKLV
jgi:adenylosuccinate lyase